MSNSTTLDQIVENRTADVVSSPLEAGLALAEEVYGVKIHRVVSDGSIGGPDDLIRGLNGLGGFEQVQREQDHKIVIEALEAGQAVFRVRFEFILPVGRKEDLANIISTALTQFCSQTDSVVLHGAHLKQYGVRNFNEDYGLLYCSYSVYVTPNSELREPNEG